MPEWLLPLSPMVTGEEKAKVKEEEGGEKKKKKWDHNFPGFFTSLN